MRKYIKRRIALIMAFILAAAAIPQDTAYALSLDTLFILAGEARAIRGSSQSYNRISIEDISLDRLSVSQEAISNNTVIYINSPEDMVKLAEKATIDAYTRDKIFILTKDIDLMGQKFTSVPVFSGVFDGQGHSIRGFTYDGRGYVSGFFRYVNQGAVIQHVNVYGNITATGEEEITGGICGINEGVISDCAFRGILKGKVITGGIAAINEVPGTIMACTNDAEIDGYYYTGGITGKNYGVTAYCENKGNINNTTEWVEGSDAYDPGKSLLETVMAESLDTGAGEDVIVRRQAGIDTGGIAGFSRGAVYECSNTATIGYEHTGYNVGGIVGRQSGFVSYCSNEGDILGRKDVGGIAGQMEPYLTLSELETLPEAVDRLHDLVDVAIDDMHDSMDVITDDVKVLSDYADDAVDAGDALGTSAKNYLNSVGDAANSLQDRVDYLSDKMPKMIDHLHETNDDIADSAHKATKLLDDANVSKRIERDPEKSASMNEAKEKITASDNTVREKIEATEEIISIVLPDSIDAARSVSGNTKKLRKSLEEMSDDLGDTLDYTKDVVKHINSMSRPTMPSLGSDFDIARDSLKDNLSGMSKVLSILADHSDITSGKVSDDLAEVNDQVNVVFHIISDQLERIGNITSGETDEIITDISEEEINSIEQGRVDHSSNIGNVEGDINVGGIAGSMSIDTDDPEENAAGSMDGGFTDKYLLRNIILDCKSDACVTSKKDGAGGIAGFMEHGIIYGCEGYGYIESTEGSYTGGIAGQSLSIIKDSYAMTFIDGKGFTGGIAGYGTTINSCVAFPMFVNDADREGAVAGQIDIEKDTHMKHIEAISGNRFVGEEIAGIDGLNIEGCAEPVEFISIVSDPKTPEDFKKIRVIFKVDDDKTSQLSVAYGTKASKLAFPMTMPDEEDEYVSWEDPGNVSITRPFIIDGTVKKLEKTLKSGELYPGTGQPIALVSGSFVETDKLSASVTAGENENEYEVKYISDIKDSVEALRLYDPFEKAEIFGVAADGSETKLDGEKKGSYMEVKGDLAYPEYRIKDVAIGDRIKSFFGGLFGK